MDSTLAQPTGSDSVLNLTCDSPNSMLEIAFCCVAQFSGAVSHQSKVGDALVYFRAAFDLANVAIHRIKYEDREVRRVISTNKNGALPGLSGGDVRIDQFSNLQNGAYQIALTATGATLVHIVLQTGQQDTDVIVFEFPRLTDAARISALVSMAPAMAVAWRMRQPGLVAALIHAQIRTRQTAAVITDKSILSEDNAYGLSRAEFRVCRLLASGMKPQLIAQELGVSIATVRTHLSNIYAKTDLPGQLEVVAHIHRYEHPVLQAA